MALIPGSTGDPVDGRCSAVTSGRVRRERQVVVGVESYRVEAALFLRRSASCCLRLATETEPYFLVNRSTRPSVSISFCLPVKNGWQFEQISRCSSGFVECVFQVAPHAQRTSTS